MQAKPPWWARISAALEYIHAGTIKIDGQAYALSRGPTRNHFVMRSSRMLGWSWSPTASTATTPTLQYATRPDNATTKRGGCPHVCCFGLTPGEPTS